MKQTILTILSVFGCLSLQAQTNDLPRTSPEAVGLRSAQVSAFFDSLLAMPQTEIHSVIVMRSGKIVGELKDDLLRQDVIMQTIAGGKAQNG